MTGEGEERDDYAPDHEAYLEEINKQHNKSVQQLLEEGQLNLLRHLIARVNTGQASHQEQAILRNLLKDNGLVVAKPPGESEEEQKERVAPDISELPKLERPDYA
ncbi:MAG: hypothetical protein AB7F96_20325 [Beijerinckiaceae bacterium]